MSQDIRLSNFPKLIDYSYGYMMQEYVDYVSQAERVFSTDAPIDFDPNIPYYRAAVGVMDVNLQDRSDASPLLESSGAFEDYYYQMSMRQKATKMKVPPNVLRAGEKRIISWFQEFSREAAREANSIKEQFFFDFLNYGPLTAGNKATFNNSIPGFVDPYPLFIYDSGPFFDGAHPQSSAVTATTYANLTESLSFSRTNLKTVINTMANTNAYDRNGKKIVISPNLVVANDVLKFTIDRELGASVEDGDLQPNVVSSGINRIYSRYITDTDAWFMFDAGAGGVKDVLIVPNWRQPEMRVWFDEEIKCNWVSFEIFYGGVVRDWRRSYACNIAAA